MRSQPNSFEVVLFGLFWRMLSLIGTSMVMFEHLNTFLCEVPPPLRTDRTNRTKLLGLSASLLAGGVARFLQPLPGPGQPPPEYQRLLPDTKVRHLPSTGWRAIPVVLLTEKMSQLSREPNP